MRYVVLLSFLTNQVIDLALDLLRLDRRWGVLILRQKLGRNV